MLPIEEESKTGEENEGDEPKERVVDLGSESEGEEVPKEFSPER